MNRESQKRLLKSMMILLIIIIGCLIIISKSLSKYENEVQTRVQSNIAFYLAKTDYMTRNIKLTDLKPSNTPYVYTFTVGNVDGNKRSEVDISYILSIITTTNIPLTYKLYMNEDYQSNDSTNLISSTNTEVARDEDGTYFQTFTFDEEELYYSTSKTNSYTLLVYYDLEDNDAKYQDTIESIRIVVDSSQIIE